MSDVQVFRIWKTSAVGISELMPVWYKCVGCDLHFQTHVCVPAQCVVGRLK